MNGPSAQQENPTILAKSPSNPLHRKIFIYVAILLLGFSLGFITWSILPVGKLPILPTPQKAQVALPSTSPSSKPILDESKPVIDESKLPVSLALLQNPIVYQWRGSVKGRITKKDDHVFTLIDEQGNSITITDKMPSGDIFKPMFLDKNNINKQLSLKDIPLGSTLLGEFFIFKGSPNTPVGSSFMKQ